MSPRLRPLVLAAAFGAASGCTLTPAPAPLPVQVPAGASPAQIVELAASVRPSPRQLAWQRTGFNAFVHFGMNTFTDREWGDGTEDPSTFAPTDFDATQWAETFRAAGMRGIVLTCKHHDGFCLWPSATTAHDVAASSWRNGNGDVVGDVAAACRAAGLKFGVYLSPWDRNQESFGTPAYQQVFLAQLRELCTDYGPLFEVWFDGAHCPPDDPELFDWQAVFQLVRELQPDAAIAITGPDVRWVGNEAGRTRPEEWSVLPLRQPARGAFERDRDSWRALWDLRSRNQQADLGSRAELRDAQALCWWAAETDVSIRPGWFWHEHEDQRVKPLATLLDYWFDAVGGNAVLLLNVPANRQGRIADPDVAVLRELGRYLDATFADPVGAGGQRLVHVPERFGGSAFDNAKGWGRTEEILFDEPRTVDVFELGEAVASHGQRVERFRIEVRQDGRWRDCATGTTIGVRRLLRTAPITGTGFRYRIDQSRGEPSIARFELYRRPTLLQAPSITRDPAGEVTIRATGGVVHFTRDGSAVTRDSERYTAPFALPLGGLVRAATFAPADSDRATFGTTAETVAEFGLARAGFRVHDCSSEQAGSETAEMAIDGDPDTIWHTAYGDESPRPPHHLTIDLGQAVTLRGFLYLPRKNGSNGTIRDYAFYGSADGETWQELAAGSFDNVANAANAQRVVFREPMTSARYVKLVSHREVQDRAWASCAELSVLVR